MRASKLITREVPVRRPVLALACVLVAGCGVGSTDTGTPTSEPPRRGGPVKQVNIAEPCSLLPESDWRAQGVVEPPEVEAYSGTMSCRFDVGGGAEGWTTIVAPGAEPMPKFLETNQDARRIEIAEYPAAMVKSDPKNCFMAVDVSDEGSLLVRTLLHEPVSDPCLRVRDFAEVAVANLPDA